MTEKYEVDSMLGDYYVKCGEGADDILFWGSRDNCNKVCDLLNEQDKEIQKLKQKVNGLKSELTIWKEDANEHIQETNKLFEENKQLKKEIKYLQSELHNATYDVRKMTLKEVKDEIEKLERWE